MGNIVLIEDDERVADVIQLHLGKRGHQLRAAGSGESGLETLQEAPAEAVILDIRLPGISGVEVLQRIRETHTALPVIVLTGQVDIDLAVDVMKKGAFDFLTKPIKTADLVTTVEKALNFKRLLDENMRLQEENENYQRHLERMVEQRTRELQDTQDHLLALRSQLTHLDQLSVAGRMASAMAHEVKNPVVGIQGYSELMLMRGELDPEVKESFEIIVKQCDRITHILTEFLHVTRPPAPKLEATDVSRVVREILRLTQPYCVFHELQLLSHVEPEVSVLADGSQLQQVLLNLIFNACHAMERGGTLTVSLSSVIGGIELAVGDNGMGIADEDLEHIFKDFFSTRRHGQGTGLGLAIVKDIVERHGGQIEVDSQVGVGTTFRVMLPADAGQSAESTPE